ncbi:hypothetical protein BH683_017795 [Williamsia sp. 1138]|uniref:MMPL/RND family transporter n=1 Tax=Williamsia sp. 1138 TaxID=1903117 RepID=UPI000A10CCAA|nr:RND family transporter [Williamsia sp. 1138]OZG27718.1 hypothetical protein BH683_017795 [Williamsia sp. 1138]
MTTTARPTLAQVTSALLAEVRRPLRVRYFRANKARRPLVARALYSFSVPVIIAWLLVAGGLNVVFPQLETVINRHAQSFMPDEASAVQALVKMGGHFGGGGSNNFVYVLIEGDDVLGDDARQYYATVLDKLTADTAMVNSAMDLWSNPDLAPAAESADGQVAYALVNLAGNMGTAKAMESTQAARDIVDSVAAPPGVQAHVTGPSAVVNDELVAIDESMILLIAICSILVTVVLLLVYRSIVTALVPLLTVGIGLAVARSVVAICGELQMISVSIFASALSAVVVLGAGTNYGIFLVGRYQEGRRNGLTREDSYYAALAGVQHIIIASGLTVAGAMACLALTRLAIFSTSGLPCTIAITVTLGAALTLGPALLAVTSRLGFLEPRTSQRSQRRWRRIAVTVARWPGPVLAATLAVLFLAVLLVPTYQPSFNERIAQPADSRANLGFAAADRHLPPNVMAPSVFLVEADHDMRNAADLIALAKLTDSIANLPGINAVQGITRPLATPIAQGTLTSQASYIGDRFTQMTTLLNKRLADLGVVVESINGIETSVDQFAAALAQGQQGLQQLATATANLKTVTDSATAKLATLQEVSNPAKDLIERVPGCRNIEPCNAALTSLSLFDDTSKLGPLANQLLASADSAARALPLAATELPRIKATIVQLRDLIAPLRSTLGALMPQVSEITTFLDEVSSAYTAGNPGAGFFLLSQALESPLFKSGMPYYFSPDGKVTRMIITPTEEGFSREAMDLSADIIPTSLTAIKGTSLAGSTVSIGGPGGTLLNIESFLHEDFIAIVIAALAFVFCVVLALLRSLVAAFVVIATVGLSFLTAWGIAIFLWQDIIGNPLHWSVAPVAFTFLVAVGADYNMLLVSRFKEEMHAGTSTGLIRAMVGTGSVVTTAGLTFGVTMFAMLASYAHNIAQIGTTVAIGLLIDTVLVRSLVVPATARLLGRWFWWPTNFVQWNKRPSHTN